MATDENEAARPARGLNFRYRFDNAEYDEAQAALRVSGQPVAVEPRPLQLLAELLRRPNEVVTKDELFEAVWAGRPTVDHVLASAVNKLRKALGAEAGTRIVNVPRVGYRFAGTVDRVVVGQVADATLELQAGDAVPGREGYRLERALDARGLVWLARHRQLQQPRVFKFATDAERLRSLKREFTLHRVLLADRAGGALPGLARLVDANFAEPPFFLECEYEGPDLVAWAAEGDPLAAMSVDERLALFIPIAQAVASAHEVGVLHKDIKPANVLMRGEPGAWQPVLTDFGSGHVLDAERLHHLGLTAMGLTVSATTDPQSLGGTAMYLAPELLGGHSATVQSDVYALGVLLYQLLAGDLKRPLATGWQRDVGDELLQQDIADATQGDAALRLGSARELIARLVRLDARRDRLAAERAEADRNAAEAADLRRRQARRPWLVAAFASLTLGLAASLWFFEQSRAALHDAQEAARRAASVSDFLHRDLLEAPAREGMRETLKPTSMLEVIRKASDRAATRFAGEPRVEGLLRRRFAETFMNAAAWPDAGKEIERALKLLQSDADPRDPDLLAARFVFARILVFLERRAEAEQVIDDAERQTGADRLMANSELAMLAARARHEFLMYGYRFDEAQLHARRLLDLSELLAREGSHERIDALRRVAETAIALGQSAAADAALNKLTAAPYSMAAARYEAHASVHLMLANKARGAGDLNASIVHFEQARSWSERAPEGRNEFYVAWCNFDLGRAYAHAGELAKALDAMDRALPIFQRVMGADHHYVMWTIYQQAGLLASLGRPQAALGLFERVDELQLRAYGKRALGTWVDFGRASVLNEMGQGTEAMRLLQGLTESNFQSMSWSDGRERVEFEIGRALWHVGRRSEGLAKMQAAIAAMPAQGTWPWLVEHQRGLMAKLQSGTR